MIQSYSNNVPVTKGERISGDTELYSLKLPSADWTQLSSDNNKKFPNRDLRLLHNTGFK